MDEFVVEVGNIKDGIDKAQKYTFTLTKEEQDFISEIGESFDYDFYEVLQYIIEFGLLEKLKSNLDKETKQEIRDKISGDIFGF